MYIQLLLCLQMERGGARVIERDLGNLDLALTPQSAMVIWGAALLATLSTREPQQRQDAVIELVRCICVVWCLQSLSFLRVELVVSAALRRKRQLQQRTCCAVEMTMGTCAQMDPVAQQAKHSFVRCTIVAIAPPDIQAWLLPLSGLVVATGIATGITMQLVIHPDDESCASFVRQVCSDESSVSCSATALYLQTS